MTDPVQCPDCAEVRALQDALREAYAHDALASKLIDAAEAEVAELKAWKAEAQQRGAEMARRGLEVCEERDCLEVEVERLTKERDALMAHLVDRGMTVPAVLNIIIAALKGDGTGGVVSGLSTPVVGSAVGPVTPPPQSPPARCAREMRVGFAGMGTRYCRLTPGHPGPHRVQDRDGAGEEARRR